MSTRWFGERVLRSEDERLLRGRGLYTDDLDQGALHACFVRSPYAHARILGIDGIPGCQTDDPGNRCAEGQKSSEEHDQEPARRRFLLRRRSR